MSDKIFPGMKTYLWLKCFNKKKLKNISLRTNFSGIFSEVRGIRVKCMNVWNVIISNVFKLKNGQETNKQRHNSCHMKEKNWCFHRQMTPIHYLQNLKSPGKAHPV